jgi:uncharacterized protein YuzE
MKLNYFTDTDSLYIDLSGNVSTDTKEIAEGINLDFDETGEIVGTDIDNASKKINLEELTINQVLARVHIL